MIYSGMYSLLSETNAWSSQKWDELPRWIPLLPSLWLELSCVGSPQLFSSLHVVNTEQDNLAFADCYRRALVCTTTDRESRVFDRCSLVDWDRRM